MNAPEAMTDPPGVVTLRLTVPTPWALVTALMVVEFVTLKLATVAVPSSTRAAPSGGCR